MHRTRFSAAVNPGKFKHLLGQLIAEAPRALLAKRFINTMNPHLSPGMAGK